MSKLTRAIHQLHQLRRQQKNVQTSELDRLVVYAATHRPGDVFGQLDTGEAGLDPSPAATERTWWRKSATSPSSSASPLLL